MMFAMLRRVIVLGLIAAGSVAAWEAGGLRSQLGPNEPPPTPAARTTRPAEQPTAQSAISGTAGQRFLAWAVFVLVMPVVTAPLAGRILGKQSNAANILLLFGYTGLDVLAAHLVGSIHVGGLLSGIGYLIGLLGVFSYNLWICAFLARLQQQ